MMLADVNVLIGAFRVDAGSHVACRRWLDAACDSPEPLAVSTLALAAVVRITTNRRAFVVPSGLEEAFGFCDDLLVQPNCRPLQPGQRHWSIFSGLVRQTNPPPKLITDAWYAALAIEHGCEWVTLDQDFGRFPGLRWRAP